VFAVIIMVPKNHMLSCHIIIHRTTSYEEVLLLLINMFLIRCESLGMNMKLVVLFSCGGE
jgi:hypothetical protein